MTTPPTRFPLQWPVGWKRTRDGARQPGQFGTTKQSAVGSWRSKEPLSIAQAVQRLLDELDRMGIRERDVVISTDLVLRQDWLPRSGQAMPRDPGAAVYWKDRNGDRCMAIDRYTKVEQNIAALAATIEAMRAIERHGGAAILDRAFTGFTALPAPIVAGMKRPWREVLGIQGSIVDADFVRRAHRTLAMQHHPDHATSDADRASRERRMAELNVARDEALKELQ